jgi:hypothetical protein
MAGVDLRARIRVNLRGATLAARVLLQAIGPVQRFELHRIQDTATPELL